MVETVDLGMASGLRKSQEALLERLIRTSTQGAVLGGVILVAGISIGGFLRDSLAGSVWGLTTTMCVVVGLLNLGVGFGYRRRGVRELARVRARQLPRPDTL